MPAKINLPNNIRPPAKTWHITAIAQGRRIGHLRDAFKWSNKELSVRTGIAAPTLSQYIHGRKGSISTLDAWRIAKACGVTTDYIIYGSIQGLAPSLVA